MNIFGGSRTQAFPNPPCLCEFVDMELVPLVATMVLSSASLWNGSVLLWIHLYDMASRTNLSNTISFLNDDLDTALNNALLVSFGMPHSSRSNYFAYLAHSCRSVSNSLVYADLVSIYLFIILLYTILSMSNRIQKH